MSLSLVVLAAGVGSRYGGPKQIDRVGPGGATLLDYAVHDARRAGFERAILVVREGMEAEMRAAVGDRIARRFRLDYAVQASALPAGFVAPAGRSKPWGTGHATLAAASLLDGPFAVINADDFYGASSYQVLAEHLQRPPAAAVAEHALVGFPLATTLSPDGPVSRGVCTVDVDGWLTSIREVVEIERDGEGARMRDDAGAWQRLPGDTPVSLNFWGFTPDVLGALARASSASWPRAPQSPTAEYYLPSAVQALVAERRARVRVLAGGGTVGRAHLPRRPPAAGASARARSPRAATTRAELWA